MARDDAASKRTPANVSDELPAKRPRRVTPSIITIDSDTPERETRGNGNRHAGVADDEELERRRVVAAGGGRRELRRVELLLGVGGDVPEGVGHLAAGGGLEVAAEDDERRRVDATRRVAAEGAAGVRDERVALPRREAPSSGERRPVGASTLGGELSRATRCGRRSAGRVAPERCGAMVRRARPAATRGFPRRARAP